MSPRRRGMAWMAAFALCWMLVESSAGLLGRPYSPYQVVWVRYGVHLGFMLAIWGWRRPDRLWSTRRPALQIGRSLLMLVMPLAFVKAIATSGSVAAVWTVFWVAPLLVLVLATLCLGERPGAGGWLASAATLAGTSVLLGPTLPSAAWPVLLAVVSAASFSLYVVLTRVLRDEPTSVNLFYTALGVFVALTPLVGRSWLPPTSRDLGVLFAIGLFGYAGLFALDRMAAAAPVSSTAPLAALQVPLAVGGQALVAHRWPGARAGVGAAFIGCAMLWLWARKSAMSVTATS